MLKPLRKPQKSINEVVTLLLLLCQDYLNHVPLKLADIDVFFCRCKLKMFNSFIDTQLFSALEKSLNLYIVYKIALFSHIVVLGFEIRFFCGGP